MSLLLDSIPTGNSANRSQSVEILQAPRHVGLPGDLIEVRQSPDRQNLQQSVNQLTLGFAGVTLCSSHHRVGVPPIWLRIGA
jgi:hypothetical protein